MIKITRTLILSILSLTAVQAQGIPAGNSTPNPPHAPASTIPSDGNYKAHFENSKKCMENIAAMKGKPCDIIFIGDSITQLWGGGMWNGAPRGKEVWARYYANRNALNFGVGWDRTQDVLWRLDHMEVKDFRPKVAVILIGTNNHADPPGEIAAGIRAVIVKTKQTFPGVKVILVSLLPRQDFYDTIVKTNAMIRRFADNKSVYYLDLFPRFLRDGDNWNGLGSDHLHPTEVGYEIWATAMNPLLNQLLEGN